MTTDPQHYRVILIDDDQEILADLRPIIETDPEISVEGVGFDGYYVLDLVQKHNPDVVLLDVEMPKMDGIEATRQIKARYPKLGVIMLTNFRHDTWLKEALEAGADGFLTKDAPRADLSAAIKRVAKGGRFMSTKPLNMLIANYEDPRFIPDPQFTAGEQALTPAERDVWQEVLKGKGNAQIAKVLHSKESTVKTHMTSIMQKFSVRSRAELLVFSAKNGAIRE